MLVENGANGRVERLATHLRCLRSNFRVRQLESGGNVAALQLFSRDP